MATVTITPRGPFSLAAGTRFLEGFTPADHQGYAPDGVLRMAMPADDGRHTVGAALRQGGDGTVTADVSGGAEEAAVTGQLARILSLDVDGTGFPAAVAADPVARGLVERYPGLRPVCFPSPYEAAAWAVIGHRIRMSQAARLKTGIARRYGEIVTVAGMELPAFPTPGVLRGLPEIEGLPAVKADRLRALADAALDGALDADRLRALPAPDALARLKELPGIGPFSAELILIRGAGHPDLFPTQEGRLHRAMAREYGLTDPSPARLAEVAERWAPYRSWVALLLRVDAA